MRAIDSPADQRHFPGIDRQPEPSFGRQRCISTIASTWKAGSTKSLQGMDELAEHGRDHNDGAVLELLEALLVFAVASGVTVIFVPS